jgi:CheY-like chemotaxis protein
MPVPPSADGRTLRILAITRDPISLAVLHDLRDEEGYQIVTHDCLDRDLDAITALNPNLIILDFVGGLRDPSWVLLQSLRTDPTTAAIPLILCLGAVHEPLPPHIAGMGISIIHTPFTVEQLRDAIRDRLDAP